MLKPELVYISSPYSNGDVEKNVERAIKEADKLFGTRFIAVIPVLSHLYDKICPHTWKEWMDYDLKLLSKCRYMIRLSGKSEGCEKEEAFARENYVHVFYSVEEFLEHKNKYKD